MEDKNLIRGSGRDWILDDIIPKEKTAEDGTPLQLAPLTLRQAFFVKEFCKDFNTTRAAKEVGVSTRAANKWMKYHDGVRRQIQVTIQDQMKTLDMDTHWVLNNTREIVERCMDEGDFMPQHALKGLELIGRRFDTFPDTKNVNINDTKVIRIESNVKFDEILPKAIDVEVVE